MKQLKAIIIGCGDRGTTYARHMADAREKFDVVAIAEPIDDRRNFVRDTFSIPEEKCFTDWHPLTELGKIADLAIIATMDRMTCFLKSLLLLLRRSASSLQMPQRKRA